MALGKKIRIEFKWESTESMHKVNKNISTIDLDLCVVTKLYIAVYLECINSDPTCLKSAVCECDALQSRQSKTTENTLNLFDWRILYDKFKANESKKFQKVCQLSGSIAEILH